MKSNQKLTSSIAMCTYNGAKYLEEQLRSFVNQTRLPDELIVCDDRSSDNTMDILCQFAKTAPFPVTVIQNEESLGVVKNFEKSAYLCKGDIIFFSDQDDIWKPEKIYRFMEIFEQQPDVGMVISDGELIDAQSKPLGTRHSKGYVGGRINYWVHLCDQNQLAFVCKVPPASWSGMEMGFKNIYRDIIFPFSTNYFHDSWLFKFYGAISHVRLIPDALTMYRIHDNNVAGKNNGGFIRQAQTAALPKTVEHYFKNSIEFKTIVNRIQERPELHVPQKILNLYLQKSEHLMTRYKIRTKQVNKWYYILRETLNGNYFRFGMGIFSIGMDVLS